MLNMFANSFFTLFEYPRWRMTSVFAFQYFWTWPRYQKFKVPIDNSNLNLCENETNNT